MIDNNNRTDIYRNIFCAICNDVTNFAYLSVTYYPTQAYKGSMLSMLNMTTAELKTFVYDLSYQIHIPRNFTPRYCLKQLITNDDATCKMYINPVFHNNNPNELYRNSFCTSNTDKKRKTETCFGKVVNFFPKPKSNDVRSHLMSILFSFSSMDKQRDEKCGEWSPEVIIFFVVEKGIK